MTFFVNCLYRSGLLGFDMRIATGLHLTATQNSWITEIQATLRTARGTAYLAQECRNEKVGQRIFKPAGHLSFFIKGWDGDWYRKLGTETIRAWPFRKGRVRYREVDHIDSRPIMSDARLDDVHPLEAHAVPIRDLYMTASMSEGQIFCPVRYLNFGLDYVQPLSGYILWHDGEEYRVGYIGVHWTKEHTSINLALNAVTNILRMHNTGKSGWLTKLSPGCLCVEDFVDVLQLNGSISFHRFHGAEIAKQSLSQ